MTLSSTKSSRSSQAKLLPVPLSFIVAALMPVLRLISNLAHFALSAALLIVTPSIVGNSKL